MRRSLDTAAHFTFVAECDWTAVAEHRNRFKAQAEAQGVRLTYLPYVLKALIEPLRRYPMLNASLDDARAEIVLHPDLHIGIATATSEGLMVPVLHHADRPGLLGLAREIQRLAEGARAHKLKLEELQGGTFTVTSTGAKGGVLATPIIHHPQVAILGVHEVKKKPAVVSGAIVARDLGNLSLALDHRVVDGATGADFLYAVVERLEHLPFGVEPPPPFRLEEPPRGLTGLLLQRVQALRPLPYGGEVLMALQASRFTDRLRFLFDALLPEGETGPGLDRIAGAPRRGVVVLEEAVRERRARRQAR